MEIVRAYNDQKIQWLKSSPWFLAPSPHATETGENTRNFLRQPAKSTGGYSNQHSIMLYKDYF